MQFFPFAQSKTDLDHFLIVLSFRLLGYAHERGLAIRSITSCGAHSFGCVLFCITEAVSGLHRLAQLRLYNIGSSLWPEEYCLKVLFITLL